MNEIKLLDKRVAGIIRWLERLKKSYSAGSMENALMDAECARADLENLRLDVWANLDPNLKPEKKFFSRLLNFTRVSSLAALIVLLTVFPISKEIQAPAIEHKKDKITLAQPIIVIREDKTEKSEKIQIKSDNNIVAAKNKKPAKTASVKKSQPIVQEKIAVKNDPEPTQKAVAYDKVFSLMQTGERALKNNKTVIKSN